MEEDALMRLRGLVTVGWLGVIAAAACLSCADEERRPQSNPVTPPLACTLIGCEDGLKIELRPESGWPAGEYRFRIQTNEVEVNCRGTLPLRSCISSDPGAQVSCDVEGVVQIVESGCALPADAHSFPGIWFDPRLRPTTVDISITRDGQPVAEAEIAPTFQRVQPNGPACPPTCDVAQAIVDLAF
jgi:hypothetical protein